jgi:acetoin utilization deacetylase AcuC-like enzyme
LLTACTFISLKAWSREKQQEVLDQEAAQFESVYLTPHSVQLAVQASTLVCYLVSSVLSDAACAHNHPMIQQQQLNTTTKSTIASTTTMAQVTATVHSNAHDQPALHSGIAIVRPPGHHASANLPSGFCLINNIAVAARYAQSHFGIERVLIVDWDIHHGNGTQSIFYDDPTVLTVSIHRWDHGRFYPSLASGGPTHVGSGPGQGFNVNIAWSCAGMGDVEYYAAFERVILPLSREFGPQLILVAAGLDAAEGDPLGGNRVTPQGFADMTRQLQSLCCSHTTAPSSKNGNHVCSDNRKVIARESIPIVMILEGGYGTAAALSECTMHIIESLLEQVQDGNAISLTDCSSIAPADGHCIQAEVDAVAMSDIEATRQALQPYWKCF